jgi:hypothetical protein
MALYPERLIQGEGVVTDEIGKQATPEPKKSDTMTFKLVPNISKRLERMARDGGRAEHSPFRS